MAVLTNILAPERKATRETSLLKPLILALPTPSQTPPPTQRIEDNGCGWLIPGRTLQNSHVYYHMKKTIHQYLNPYYNLFRFLWAHLTCTFCI